MKSIWNILNSRKFASWQLFALLVLMVISAALPNQMTVSPEHWAKLQAEKPAVFWLASHLSTPFLVRSWPFVAVCVFLFFSTLACTATRINRWLRLRRSEFEKERAFSFSLDADLPQDPASLRAGITSLLEKRAWECDIEGDTVAGTKGLRYGFWGSVVFHGGLLLCFMAAPISAFTVFRGEFVVTEDVPTPLREGFVYHEGKPASSVPPVDILVRNLRGVYAEGIFKYDFGGDMLIGPAEMAFSVNKPVNYAGYQISIDSFGYSPNLVIEREGEPVFDYFLNLRHPNDGDYFEIPSEGFTLFALLFPDFVQEGTELRSRSRELNNPVLLMRLLRGTEEVHSGLLRPGGELSWNGYRFSLPEIRRWGGFMVVREQGIAVMALGFLVGIIGLLVRFLSNERRLEFRIAPGERSATRVTISGFSRYYPAFLEKEVRTMNDTLGKGGNADVPD